MNSTKKKKFKLSSFLYNRYFIFGIFFLIWIVFLDDSSVLKIREYNKEIEDIKALNKFYKQNIEKDSKAIKSLEDLSKLERIAREKYFLKNKEEDIYIVEFDSIN